MKKNFYITAFLLFGISMIGFSQSSKIDYANRAYNKHLYETAVKLYSKVLDKRRSLKNPKIRLAECYRLLDEWHEAELWYEKLVNASQRPKKEYVYLYVQALQTNGKYEVALDWIEPLVEKDSTDKLAQLLYNACLIDTVEKYNEDFLDYYEVSKLPFNTEEDEFSPILLEDNSLLFSRGQTGKTYSWYVPVYEPYSLKFLQAKPSQTGSNSFNFSKKLRKYSAFSSNPQASASTISYDGQQAMYMRYDRKFCGKNHPNLIPYKIFTAQKQGNVWGYHLPFDYNADEYTCVHPAMSEDGLTIYFSSDMPGGFGGMDLYSVTFIDGEWSEPKNLGETINSAGDEVFPFIHYATGKFYFSSNGQGGMGGFDIFWTSKIKKQPWQTPQYFGAPINSRWNDYNIFINKNDNFGLISSDRKGGQGGVDLYSFERLD
jgi:tetratricopeptide (TPR) repeat protein